MRREAGQHENAEVRRNRIDEPSPKQGPRAVDRLAWQHDRRVDAEPRRPHAPDVSVEACREGQDDPGGRKYASEMELASKPVDDDARTTSVTSRNGARQDLFPNEPRLLLDMPGKAEHRPFRRSYPVGIKQDERARAGDERRV